MWEKVSDDFFREDTPYGAGDFRIRGNSVISIKRSKPETSTKPLTAEELADPGSVAQYTEPWMADPNERANRRTVRFIIGTVDGRLHRTLERPAQRASWWFSSDWKTLLVATGWTDFRKAPKPGERYIPQVSVLFRSIDQGRSWQQLQWPEASDISYIRFLDTQRGYVIGWGPRIWRTTDGGQHWVELPVPSLVQDPMNPRRQFDAVVLGRDGVLRFSFVTRTSEHPMPMSQVYMLRWTDVTPSLDFTLRNQTVVDLADHLGHIYVLAWRGTSTAEGTTTLPTTTVSYLGASQVELRHEFAQGYKGYALYITPSGGILVDGVEEKGKYSTDMTAVSYDHGKSWKVEDEGRSSQGGYYDVQSGTRWRVAGYSLYKRQIP